jgi:hypothetical protein
MKLAEEQSRFTTGIAYTTRSRTTRETNLNLRAFTHGDFNEALLTLAVVEGIIILLLRYLCQLNIWREL